MNPSKERFTLEISSLFMGEKIAYISYKFNHKSYTGLNNNKIKICKTLQNIYLLYHIVYKIIYILLLAHFWNLHNNIIICK